MESASNSITRRYIDLAFAIEKHVPGYVDAYVGPDEWKKVAVEKEKISPEELFTEAKQLEQDVFDDCSLRAERRKYFISQIAAMQGILRLIEGETMMLEEETRKLFDVQPAWVDECIFRDAHQALDVLLPPGDSLIERISARRKSLRISVEQVKKIIPIIIEHLRQLACARYPLPEEETFEVVFVKDKPWSGYNWYLGNARSRIEINTDLPFYINTLPALLAHEGYPGHHTELSIKDRVLVKEKGWLENSIMLLYTPFSVISEGIAMRAIDQLMTKDEQVDFFVSVLYPLAGFKRAEARREFEIDLVLRQLEGTSGNAAFMYHDRGASKDEIVAYLQRYALDDIERAEKTVQFISQPYQSSYIFNYYYGLQMLEELLDDDPEADRIFNRLLSEPVTPSEVRSWIKSGVK
jgi:hypothetical protein